MSVARLGVHVGEGAPPAYIYIYIYITNASASTTATTTATINTSAIVILALNLPPPPPRRCHLGMAVSTIQMTIAGLGGPNVPPFYNACAQELVDLGAVFNAMRVLYYTAN